MIPAISGAIGPLGTGEWSIGGVGGAGGAGGTVSLGAAGATGPAAVGGAGGNGSDTFSGALSGALNALETSQANATTASQGLATGQVADPTQAITAVENASLAMDLASQIRDKLVSAENTIFSTQV